MQQKQAWAGNSPEAKFTRLQLEGTYSKGIATLFKGTQYAASSWTTAIRGKLSQCG